MLEFFRTLKVLVLFTLFAVAGFAQSAPPLANINERQKGCASIDIV